MDDAVRVWWASLELQRARAAALRAALSADERARATRFARPALAERWSAARGQLREVLGRELGLPARAVPIVPGPHGKPRLDPDAAGTDVRFNLAHSGEWAVIAVARAREVGVDLERHGTPRDLERLARRVLGPGELAAWQALGPRPRIPAFYEAWTRKEAYAKALGEGLGLDLAAHALVPSGTAGRWRVAADRSGASAWLIVDLPPPREGPSDPADSYSAAVAVESESAAVPVEVGLLGRG